MTQKTLMELTKIITKRYLQAKSRKEKTKILDEYCANTNLNRKYAITKIRSVLKREKVKKKRGRKVKYSKEVDALLIEIWQIYNCICAERLHPFLKEGVRKLEECGYLKVCLELKKDLLNMSTSSIKRRISKHKHLLSGQLSLSTTKPGSLLKKNIPIQTTCWNQELAGYCELDLVAHCGGSLLGEFVYTLQFVDIKTTWTERKAVMGKSQERVFEKIVEIQNQLPFDLKGIDSDNGGEFINQQLYRYCKSNNIAFTRSRPYMSKDNAHIEQKNWSTVRKVLGYERFDTKQTQNLINSLYDNELRLFINFFQPTLKLIEKTRVGSKYKRKHDSAKTPYQRVLECPEIPQERKDKLTALYRTLNPVELQQGIKEKIHMLMYITRK